MPKVLLLTSTHCRHRFVATLVAEKLDLLGLLQEEKSFVPETYAGSKEDLDIIRSHFALRDASEEAFFGKHTSLHLPKTTLHRHLTPGTINDAAELERMVSLKPDVVLVYGTGILRAGIIEAFPGRIINIHLGLSPFYRGSGTNFWPLVNREPEYVGATIHYLDAGIDTGPIICHVRPEIAESDGPHEIGNKAIIAAADAFIRAAKLHVEGKIKAHPQRGEGKLYRRQDFSADAVRRMRKNFETGMIPEYLAQKTGRDARIPLVSF